VVVSCHQNVGQSHNLQIANKSFEKVATFQVFGDRNNKSELHL
jgi:hypothetical protein